MKEKIDVLQSLRVFQKVIDYGERENGYYALNGIRANTHHDGYTVTLSDGDVDLHIFFHNKYSLECEDRKQLDQFIKRLNQLDNE